MNPSILNRRGVVIVACVALGLAVSGCGSSTKQASTSTQSGSRAGSRTGSRTGQFGQGGAGHAFGGGGSGKVAAVAGSTAQVQNQQGQVAVTWTSATKFSRQVATTASMLKVGDCVVATPSISPANGGSTSGSTSGVAPKPNAPVAAGSVRITAASNGSCASGLGGRGGGAGGFQRGGGSPNGSQGSSPGSERAPSSGAPSGRPTGGFAGRGGFGGFGAFGKVTSISGSGFAVASPRPTRTAGSSTPSSAPTTTMTAVQVTTSATTTWTITQPAAASAVKVGQCVTSIGKTSSTGAITATTMTISAPVGGSCTSGFGFGGRGGFSGSGRSSSGGTGQQG